MELETYFVGEKPGGTWTFQVLNQKTGTPENLAVFNSARVIMLDSDNNEVELAADSAVISNPASGIVAFVWPSESVFTKPGRYVMQIELSSGVALRKTTVQEILVKKMGGITK